MADKSSSKGATFTFVLGIFAGFAILLAAIQALFGDPTLNDPREEERLKFKDEIAAAQTPLLDAMGLKDKSRTADLLEKTAEVLKAKTPKASTMLVPGSPTQMKQMAAPPPAAAPAAPAPASKPATAPAPAPATPAPAPATPAPAPATPAPAPATPAPAPATPAPAPATPAPAPATPAPPK